MSASVVMASENQTEGRKEKEEEEEEKKKEAPKQNKRGSYC